MVRSVLHYGALKVPTVGEQAGPMAAAEVAEQQREEARAWQEVEAELRGLQPSQTVPAAGQEEAEEGPACFCALEVGEAPGARETQRYFRCYGQPEKRDAVEVVGAPARLHLEAGGPYGEAEPTMAVEVSPAFRRDLLARRCEGV